ncbi:unnamed protein product [Boreogadus saida]
MTARLCWSPHNGARPPGVHRFRERQDRCISGSELSVGHSGGSETVETGRRVAGCDWLVVRQQQWGLMGVVRVIPGVLNSPPPLHCGLQEEEEEEEEEEEKEEQDQEEEEEEEEQGEEEEEEEEGEEHDEEEEEEEEEEENNPITEELGCLN